MNIATVLFSLYCIESKIFFCQSLDSVFQQNLLSSEVILVEGCFLMEELDKVIRMYIANFMRQS